MSTIPPKKASCEMWTTKVNEENIYEKNENINKDIERTFFKSNINSKN